MAVPVSERVTMTLDEFLALPEEDENGNHFELDEGELVTVSPAGVPHGRRIVEISSYLRACLSRDQYDVVAGETGILMALDPKPTVRGTDIAVLYREDAPEQGMLRKAPLLVVEVVSPSNDPIDLDRKRRQYQEFGVPETWFVYNETKTIYIYRNQPPHSFICEWPDSFHSSSLDIPVDTRDVFR